MTKNQDNEPSELTQQYIALLSAIRSKNTPLKSLNIENLLQESNNLLDQIKKPSTLKLDALVINQTTKLTSSNFSKRISNSSLTIPVFIEMLKNNDYRFFEECERTYTNGIEFSKKINLRYEERRTLSRSLNRSVVDTEAEEPNGLMEREEKACLTEKIGYIVAKYKRIEYFLLVIDPNSYSKTIENIFYCAFAVRRGIVNLICEDEKLYVCSGSGNGEEAEHLIIEITYKEYLQIIKKLQIQISLL
ncbi:Non-structural maintenance of chromosomes element 4 A [Conglomerata obtusa]